MNPTASVGLKPPSVLRFVLVALTVPLLLFVVVIWLHGEFARSEALREEAIRSFERQTAQILLLSRLKDAETAQRGYLLTGNPQFLSLYEPARGDVRKLLADARAAGDTPHAYLDAVGRVQEAKFAELDRTVRIAATGDRAGAARQVADGTGRRYMDDLRRLIGGRIAAETRQLDRARAASLAYRERVQRGVYTVVGILIGVVLTGLLILWQLRRQRHALLVETLEAGKRHQTILDSTIDAILILNPSGTVEGVNAAATRMLGYRAQDLERRDISTILDLAPGEGSFYARMGLVDGRLRRSFLADRSVRHRDGHLVSVDVAVGVMDVPSGVHLVVSLRDIAERKRLERIKDELISTVTHELRTPLTSVVGALGLLRAGAAGDLPASAVRLVDIAESNSRRLIRLINDMLDIDRIESGKLVMERAPTDARAVMEQACLGSEGVARANDVTLRYDPNPEPITVHGDADRLIQVVTNLVSNAVRAAPAGSAVELGIAVEDGQAILAVDDRGPGVPLAFRDRIFGRFERAPADEGSVGTGLGLAISREIVTRHGGTIWFEDRVGGGTRFAVSLPLARTLADEDRNAPVVLVCEADDEIAAELTALVVAEGCAVERVRSAAEGQAALGERSYGAVLVSIGLPEEGGLAFAHAARDGNPPYQGPIVIVAAHALCDGSGPSGLELVDWVDKGSSPERLGRALRAALSRSTARQPIVLHLDDDPDLLEVVAAAIEPEARLIGATDLTAARNILQEVTPDLAILDLQLAEGSGLDLIPFLLGKDGTAIPTIIYSAQDVSPEQARAADAVLVKARGTIPDLKATVRRVVRDRITAA